MEALYQLSYSPETARISDCWNLDCSKASESIAVGI